MADGASPAAAVDVASTNGGELKGVGAEPSGLSRKPCGRTIGGKWVGAHIPHDLATRREVAVAVETHS